MKTNRFIFLFLLLALLSAPVIGQAQEKIETNLRHLILKPPKKSKAGSPLALIRQLISRGAFISAADMLEDMYSSQPENMEIFRLLLDCYLQLKAYPRAELLILQKLEKHPFGYQFHDYLLEVYFKSGIDSLVQRQVGQMLEKFPGDIKIYGALIKRLIKFSRPRQAMELIKSGRLEFDADNLFALEAASILQIRGSYYEAVMEYFHSIGKDSTNAKHVDRRLAALLQFPGALTEIKRALGDILDSLPNNKNALKTLGEAYIKSENFAEAFDVSIRLDSLNGGKGNLLFRYMKQCHERKLYAQVIETAEYIAGRDYKKLPYADYKYYYGEALAAVGRYDDAIANYREIFDEYPHSRDKAEALLKIGHVYRYYMSDYKTARVYYDSVVSFYQIEPVNSSGLYETALLYLVEGRLDEASQSFVRLREKSRASEFKELVDYNLAMIQLYNHLYDEADLAFRQIIVNYPRGFYVNDALVNSLIIGETQPESPQALNFYCDALLYELREMPDSVFDCYNSIIAMGASPVIGMTMYRLSAYYLSFGDTTRAIEIIDEMEKQYGEDYFFPYCLKLRADIYSTKPDKIESALEIYTDILKNHQTYPFIGEVRQALQKISPVNAGS